MIRLFMVNVCHKNYNLDKKDNLDTLPTQPACFWNFAIHSLRKPVHWQARWRNR